MQLLKILASMGDNTDLQCFKTTIGMSPALSLDNSQIISEISLTVMSSKNIDDSSAFGRNLKKLLRACALLPMRLFRFSAREQT